MNKFRKLFLSLIFMFVCVLGLTYNVKAEEEYRIDVVAKTGSAGASLKMSLEGIDKEETINNSIYYWIKFVKNQNEKLVLPDDVTLSYFSQKSDEIFGNYYRVSVDKEEDGTYSSEIKLVPDDWYLMKEYNHAHVVKCVYSSEQNKTECDVTENPIALEKTALPKLTQRYKYRFSSYGVDSQLALFPHFPYRGEIGSHEINVKLGVINDQQLLKSISKNETGSYEDLINYAKTNDGTVYTVKDSDVTYNIDNIEIIEGAYYYIYSYYNNEDGLYRNLDDITIAMGNSLGYLTNDVVFNFEDSLWDKFVEKFKNTDLVKSYDDSEAELKIESTDNTLTVTLTVDEETYVTKFNYEDGILKYDSESKDDELILVDNLWQVNAIYALSDLKGYDFDKVSDWLKENEDKVLTITNDGIAFKTKAYSYTDTDENGATTNINGKILTSFELDIEDGLKTYNEEKIADYKFISGANQKYKVNETKELKFEINAEYSQFESVYINGKLLDKSNYTVSEGEEGTKLVLKTAYLNKLNNGTHTLKVTFKDGKYAETKFTIENNVENPNTGINSKTTIFIIIGLICVATYLIVRKQSKFPKHN